MVPVIAVVVKGLLKVIRKCVVEEESILHDVLESAPLLSPSLQFEGTDAVIIDIYLGIASTIDPPVGIGLLIVNLTL